MDETSLQMAAVALMILAAFDVYVLASCIHDKSKRDFLDGMTKREIAPQEASDRLQARSYRRHNTGKSSGYFQT
jgi:hypothetical protein